MERAAACPMGSRVHGLAAKAVRRPDRVRRAALGRADPAHSSRGLCRWTSAASSTAAPCWAAVGKPCAIQTSYAKGVEHLGIARGIEGSKAKHKTVREFYPGRRKAPFSPLPEVKTPNPGLASAEPEKPGFSLGRRRKASGSATAPNGSGKAAWEAQRKQHMAEVKAQRDAAVETARRHQAQAAKAAALAKEVQTLKTENSRLLAERQTLKTEADRLRGTDLADVLERVYGAQEAADSRRSYRTRKFELGEHGNIAVTGGLRADAG